MTSLWRVTGLAVIGLVVGLAVPARAAESSEVVKITATADKPDKDGNQVVTIKIDIDKGWHLYANPVGQDSLRSVQTTILKPEKGEIVSVDYPKGTVHKDADVGDFFIYEGSVTIKATVKRDKDAKDVPELTVKIQACSDKTCNLPSKVKVAAK